MALVSVVMPACKTFNCHVTPLRYYQQPRPQGFLLDDFQNGCWSFRKVDEERRRPWERACDYRNQLWEKDLEITLDAALLPLLG